MSTLPSSSDQTKGDSRPSSAQGASKPSQRSAPVSSIDHGQAARPSHPPPQQSPAQPFFRVPESPRSNASDAQHVAAKVAIPRLKRDVDFADGTAVRGGARHRVNHACEPCRHRKTKCSGERPVCKHCQDFKIACFYADGKRDRVKKQFGTMAEKVGEYEKLLRSLLDRASEEDAQLIRTSLDKATQSDIDEPSTDVATMPSIEVMSENEVSGGAESEVSADVGSTGELDQADEDFTREGAKQTGYMGKNSEITWLQRLRQVNKFGDAPTSPASDGKIRRDPGVKGHSTPTQQNVGDDTVPLAEVDEGFTIHETSYHLDDLAISTFDAVDPYEMPTIDTAQILFSTFMHRVQPTLPVLGRTNLTSQFQRYLANPQQKAPEKWLAIINMIFAIAAKYSHLIQAEWKGDDRDHLIYFTRARLLAVDQEALFKHPDLQQIQILALMSFYLLSIGQINRSWMLNGAATRAACALGLNVRNESTKLKESLKEIRYRLWWSLYTLEHRLCSITGRVNGIADEHCTTPLPIPIDEDKFDSEEAKRLLDKDSQQRERAPSSNAYSPGAVSSAPSEKRSVSSKSEPSRSPSTLQTGQADLDWAKDTPPSSSLYFLHLVQLSRLTHKIFQYLYNPTSVEGTWSDVQSRIKELDGLLETWYRTLPPTFDFRRKQRDRDYYEYRLSLGFAYYGTKQVIHRPCLCRLDRKVPGQSVKSHEFNRAAAMTCVEAALDCLRLIPDEPNAVGLISVGPWWAILHWLVQAATVLMLEIAFRANHMPQDADSILESSKKAVRWLHALGEDNLSAKRAWQLCNTMLHDAAGRIGRDVKDLPQQPPATRSGMSSGGMFVPGISSMHTQSISDRLPQGSVDTGPFTNGMSMAGFQAFSDYDTFMQYDQYFPGGNSVDMLGVDGRQSSYATHGDNFEPDFTSSSYQNRPS